MSVQDAEKFTEEVRRYTEARRAARKIRNMVANLNMALAVAAQHGVVYDLTMKTRDVNPGRSDCQSTPQSYGHVTIECMQVLEANEPADWVLDKFREAARGIATEEETQSCRMQI